MIVTGGSAGIGRAIVARFLADGHRVISLARRPCPVAGAESMLVDLADSTAVSAVIRELGATLPEQTRLHLIHNAASLPADSADHLDPAVLEHSLRLAVVTPAMLDAGLLPRMLPGSSIVFVGSTLCEKAVAGRLSYVTSKHALVGLLRATVQDLFGRGIHAACVAPGFTDTDMLRPAIEANPAYAEAVRRMVSFGRLLRPEEIADIVAFAAATPALNGALLHANLGQREA
ncbi:MAG: SDR family oxidoreductase [Myxococcales bacterium]|nr:SDR family oxidoreductase [Myxococcales bacterium]